MDTLYRWPAHRTIIEEYNMAVCERYFEEYSPPHWHEFYEFELYLTGNGSTNMNGKEYRIVPNTLCFLTPTDFHSFGPDPGNRFLQITFTFTPDCIEDSVISEFITLCHGFFTTIDDVTANRLAYMTRCLSAEVSANAYLNKKYIQNMISCILIELLRLQRQDTEASLRFHALPFPVQKALYYIRTHFKEPVTLNEVSEFAGFSSNYMSKVIHESLGIGFKEYLTDLRLNYAKQLLLLSNESITDISYFSGFNSLSHFLHVFNKKYKESPLQFRKRNRTDKR